MSSEETPTCAELLAATLAAHGCRRVFGIPGGEVLAIIEALAAEGIEFILTKHENAAGFMAEGAWQSDGFPPVLIATLGPGVANAVNVVANAMQDRVPLIFISGCVDAQETKTYTHQIFDHGAMLKPIVKASFMASASTTAQVTRDAIALSREPQFGPVHLDVPVSVAENAAAEEIAEALLPIDVSAYSIDQAQIVECAKLLEMAVNPIAIAGVDAVNENAGPAIEAFCRKFNLPLITTYKAKGLIDERDELAIGGAGLSPKADKIILPTIQQSDCILLLGYDPIEMRIGWRKPWPANVPVIEITPVERNHGMHQVSHTLTGSVAPTVDQLASALKPGRNNVPENAKNLRATLQTAFSSGDGFGPDTVFETLRTIMPSETVSTADSGAHRILLSQMWQCPSPKTLLQSSALCTMACAVPIAAGYKLASPKTPVLAFVGDAGLEMGLGELATLREYAIPIVIIVLVDESLTLIEMKQRDSGRPNLGVDFSGSDFPAVANAMGGKGVWVDDTATLEKEANAALQHDTFTILACRIGRKSYDGKF